MSQEKKDENVELTDRELDEVSAAGILKATEDDEQVASKDKPKLHNKMLSYIMS